MDDDPCRLELRSQFTTDHPNQTNHFLSPRFHQTSLDACRFSPPCKASVKHRRGDLSCLSLVKYRTPLVFSALLSLIKYLADPYNQLPAIVYWLMGNLSLADRSTVLRVSVPIGLGLAILMASARHLNVLSMGDEEAAALGINVRRVRLLVITAATLISALTVVIAGAVGWVGLIIPHIARMLVGPDNETLLPVSALLGAGYLIVVDDVARLAFAFELPIGIVTALVGIPFFMLVLGNARKGWQ